MKRVTILLIMSFLSACSTFKPQLLDYSVIDIEKPKHQMAYGVYTPPNWQQGEALPLILLLHGGGGSHYSFERFGSVEYLDEKIINGEIPRVIIVTPNGNNGFWENWADGSHNYRDWVLDRVLPKVQQDYQTLNCPEHCHLAGISMGGFGVLRFANLRKESFSSVSVISAPIYNNEDNEQKTSWLIKLLFPLERIFGKNFQDKYHANSPYKAWLTEEQQVAVRLQLIWGENDHNAIKLANQKFHQHLIDNQVEHDFYIYPGRHKWVDWIPNFSRIINFLVKGESGILVQE